MSNPCWTTHLHRTLKRLPPRDPARDGTPRVAVLGIGNDLNGDDGAGVAVARALRVRLSEQDRLLVVDGGHAPENHTGTLRAFAPALVVMVDAAQMHLPPGSIRWLDWQDTSGLSATTHTLPPYMLARFLTLDLGCAVALVGIQPFRAGVDTPLSEGMQAAVAQVVDGFIAAWDAVRSA